MRYRKCSNPDDFQIPRLDIKELLLKDFLKAFAKVGLGVDLANKYYNQGQIFSYHGCCSKFIQPKQSFSLVEILKNDIYSTNLRGGISNLLMWKGL